VTFAKAREMRLGGVEPGARLALALEAAVEAFPRATHFYMLSGDCMAVKSADYAHAFLDRARCRLHRKLRFLRLRLDQDGPEARTADLSPLFNERTQKRLFYGMMNCSGGWGSSEGAIRHPGHDRQPVVVPAPPHGGGGARFHPASARTWCGSSAPPGSRTRRSSRPWCATSCPTGRSQPLADLQDVHRLRDAGHLLQRPVRPADQPGLPFRAQDQPRGARAQEAAGRALDVGRTDFTVSREGPKLYSS
jgi:hypothetical protein